MSALIVDLRPVRNAVEQSQRLGTPEPRQAVVDRVLADMRAGHHPYRTAQLLFQQRVAQGSAT